MNIEYNNDGKCGEKNTYTYSQPTQAYNTDTSNGVCM